MQKWEYRIIKFYADEIEKPLNGRLFEFTGLENPYTIGSNGYCYRSNGDPVKLTDYINYLGSQGWELVSASPIGESKVYHSLYFKRPIE